MPRPRPGALRDARPQGCVADSNIRIVRFHTQMYRGFRSLEFWLFRRGLGSANFGTVVQIGEYVALLLGYKRIELYGVDHTLLDGLCVDDGNRLCRIDRHYYDGAEAELFRGHEVLRDYAAALGARIVNRTRGSMIDAYERNPE